MEITIQDSQEKYSEQADGFILAIKKDGFISIRADGISFDDGSQMLIAMASSLDRHRLGD